MPRRFLAVLIAVAYLAGQLAAAPHTHAVQPAGHASRAHIHIKGPASSHDHHHRHHHDHGHPGSHDSPINSAPVDHDDNCSYLPYSVAPAKVQLPDAAVAYAGFAENSSPHATALLDSTAIPFAPPDVLRSGCDLCLTLRTLRI